MNKKVLAFITFVVGAGMGAVGSGYFFKKKYEKMADTEIKNFKVEYTSMLEETNKKNAELASKIAKQNSDMKGESPELPPMDPNRFIEDAEDVEDIEEDDDQAIDIEDEEPEFITNVFEIYGAQKDISNETKPNIVNNQNRKDSDIYLITDSEFGELDDYNLQSLTYTKDNYLLDEYGEIIDNIDVTIGEDSLAHFSDYDGDAIYVRNDIRMCDYEVLRDLRTLEEIQKI